MKTINLIILICISFLFLACQDKDNNNISSKKKYENQIITIITPNFDKKITGPIKKEAKKFEEETGATLRIVYPSWDDMVPMIKESLDDDRINYDIFVVFSSWGGSILSKDNAQEIPDWVKRKIDWDDVLPIYKEYVLSWNKKDFFLPYDGDCVNLYYRKDILSNKIYKQKFKKEFGYELSVPKTWKEFNDISKFFNDWDWDDDGEIEYGFAGSRRKGYGTILLFFTQAAAYAKYPNDKEFYFDKDMNPKINNPAFVKALDEYIAIMKYAPKQINNFSPAEVRQSFIAGEVVLAIDWADLGTMAQNSKESLVKDKVGFATLPGSNQVYNSKTSKWENIYNSPSSISGNWVFVVNKKTKNKQLAFDFASYMSSKEMTTKLITKGSSGINPSRYSHLTNNFEQWKENGFSKQLAKEYLNTISNELSNKNVLIDIRIPGADMYYSSFDKYINKAIKGELSSKEALDLTAKEWNEITQKLGLEKQKKFYKESINE